MIREVRLELVTGRLESGVESSTSRWTRRSSLLITLVSDSGLVGQGEASPLPGYSPDALEACRAALTALPAAALGAALCEPDATTLLERALQHLPPLLPAARFGLEMALLDLAGKLRGAPSFALLGERQPSPFALAALLGKACDPALGARAQRALQDGFTTLKLKIGVDEPARELEALRTLRSEIGPDVRLRLDANRAYDARDVAERLAELATIAPELVEEPTDIVGLPTTSPVPLALDESLQGVSAADLAARLEVPSVRAVVLKPMALGGILHCRALARVARERGLSVVVSHLFDGPLGLAGAALLAFDVGSPDTAMGLGPHAGLDVWPEPRAPAVSGAWLRPWSGAGLGLPRFSARPS